MGIFCLSHSAHRRDAGTILVFAATRLFTNPLRAALFAIALALAVVSYDFTRIFVIVSTPMLLQMTREVVADHAPWLGTPRGHGSRSAWRKAECPAGGSRMAPISFSAGIPARFFPSASPPTGVCSRPPERRA